mmetsp:Transcript_46369/g.34066  ORF Transcript_46369/g.34066 Transcript_46369/m.34066 type:complete len:151 (+) Transcript_46369:1094-1546(+)
MFARQEIRRSMLFAVSDWNGGFYATSSMNGSRPGFIAAMNWASLMSIGKSGYRSFAKQILDAAANLKRELAKVPEITILSRHDSSIVAFTCKKRNPIALGDVLQSRYNWMLNKLLYPPALHIVVTAGNMNSWQKLVDDVKASLFDMEREP